jgi:hypothetical protein
MVDCVRIIGFQARRNRWIMARTRFCQDPMSSAREASIMLLHQRRTRACDASAWWAMSEQAKLL